MKSYAVYDRKTKEILACITENDDGSIRIISNENVSVKMYNDTEPVFHPENGKVCIADNAISVDPAVWGRNK